jgi:hypothetical protein
MCTKRQYLSYYRQPTYNLVSYHAWLMLTLV